MNSGLYESNWFVIFDTPSLSKNSLNFIYFDTSGSSIRKIIKFVAFDTKCVIFDTLFRFIKLLQNDYFMKIKHYIHKIVFF